MIYEHVFYDSTYQWWDINDKAFALRQTCRQVRHEARPAFFKYTEFKFKNWWDFQSVICVDRDIWSDVQSIELDYHTASTFDNCYNFGALNECKHIYVTFCPPVGVPHCGPDVPSLKSEVMYWYGYGVEVHMVPAEREEYERSLLLGAEARRYGDDY
jgi:hypothetical protein